jgi:hypothetical protein
MRSIKSAAIAALLSCSLITPATPAYATTTDPYASMAATCAATNIVRPDPESTYAATLDQASVSPVVGAEYEISRTTVSSTPGGVLLGTTGKEFVPGTEGRNGGSPNIFGEFKSTATYSGGSLEQSVVYGQDTTYTFGCTVSKTNKQGKTTTPDGLQVSGLTLKVTNTTRTETETKSAPNVTTDFFTSEVVCISPLRNPGVWRAKDGYSGECSTARYIALGTAFIRTNSVPDLPPIGNQSDHNSSRNGEASLPASVTDNDHEMVEGN